MASAQGGNDISLNNLNQNLAAPKFVSDSPDTCSIQCCDSQHTEWKIYFCCLYEKWVDIECLKVIMLYVSLSFCHLHTVVTVFVFFASILYSLHFFFLQKDTNSPLLSVSVTGTDSQWAIRVSWSHLSRTKWEYNKIILVTSPKLFSSPAWWKREVWRHFWEFVPCKWPPPWWKSQANFDQLQATSGCVRKGDITC